MVGPVGDQGELAAAPPPSAVSSYLRPLLHALSQLKSWGSSIGPKKFGLHEPRE